MGINKPTPIEGLGDVVEKVANATGLDKVAKIYTKVTGKDCGCQGRKQRLNKKFPLNESRSNGQ